MLANSHLAEDSELKDIAESTAAVLFLGTPHRGSKDVASVGEVARKAASIIMDTSPSSLDALGLKPSDLERCQEAFSRLWRAHDFRVKTFQESTGMTTVNVGLLNEKVVPDISSTLGDSREQAEMLVGNHKQICRISGPEDPNFDAIVGELRRMYMAIVKINEGQSTATRRTTSGTEFHEFGNTAKYEAAESACLQSLMFPEMTTREKCIRAPVARTCTWLSTNVDYQLWRNRERLTEHDGLIWIKGNPGSGKSTLMKAALLQVLSTKPKGELLVASFYFDARGVELAKTPLGFYRSLVYQLIKDNKNLRKSFLERRHPNLHHMFGDPGDVEPWQEGELLSYLEWMYSDCSTPHTVLFVDALDECGDYSAREVATFLRKLTMLAADAGVALDVCISSRRYPQIIVGKCLEIYMESFNRSDIAVYVDERFSTSGIPCDQEWLRLRDEIVDKSSGIFLWAVLVSDMLLKCRDQGRNLVYMQRQLQQVPQALQDLFIELLRQRKEGSETTMRLFQWTTLSLKPLRLREWHHILAFITNRPPPISLKTWKESADFTESDEQLMNRIMDISRGLVVARQSADPGGRIGDETVVSGRAPSSLGADPGSLDHEQGETRLVHTIHESVSEFFLHGTGFSHLSESHEMASIGQAHLAIAHTCLDYIHIEELDALVRARRTRRLAKARKENLKRRAPRDVSPSVPTRRSSSVASFSSAGSSDYRIEDLPQSFHDFPDSLPRSGPPSNGNTSNTPRSNGSMSNASTRSPQILEDFPALLSYATMMLLPHIRLAEASGVDTGKIMTRLEMAETWERFKYLREDLDPGIAFRSFAVPTTNSKLFVKVSGARGLRQSQNVYFVVIFQGNEAILVQRRDAPVMTPGSNVRGSKRDVETVFDVVGSATQVEIFAYEHEHDTFLGHVVFVADAMGTDKPFRTWLPLRGYADATSENEATGEIHVEALYQRLEKQQVGPSSFEIVKLMGKGVFNETFQVRKRDTQRVYAMKVLQTKFVAQEGVARAVGERKIRVRPAISDSPFIVGLKFSFQTPSQLFLVTDYLSGGTLSWHIQHEGRFLEDQAKFYTAEIILAIQHLHHNGIIFRDLNPENILLDANGHIALCDFGLSKANLTENDDATNRFSATMEYLAPEILSDESGYTGAVDFWSIGVVFFEMCCGRSPFYAENPRQMRTNITSRKVRLPRDTFSQGGRDFLKRVLNRDPRHRIGAIEDARELMGLEDARELMGHPFFVDINWYLLARKLLTPPFTPKHVLEPDSSEEMTGWTSGSLS